MRVVIAYRESNGRAIALYNLVRPDVQPWPMSKKAWIEDGTRRPLCNAGAQKGSLTGLLSNLLRFCKFYHYRVQAIVPFTVRWKDRSQS